MTKDWNSKKSLIYQYYAVEKYPLSRVIRLMQDQHDFKACIRAYRNKISEWGFLKAGQQSQDGENGCLPTSEIRHTTSSPVESSIGRSSRPRSSPYSESPPPQPSSSVSQQQQSHFVPNNFITSDPMRAADVALYDAIQNMNEPRISEMLSSSDSWRNAFFYCPPGYCPSDSSDHGESYINLAAKKNSPGILSLLLSTGSDVNLSGKRGRTALHVAALSGSSENIRILEEFGACPTYRDNDGAQPLHLACLYNRLDATRELLRLGADINDCCAPFWACSKRTIPLKIALEQRPGVETAPLIRLLLEEGALVSPRDSSHQQLLQIFIQSWPSGYPWWKNLSYDQKKCLGLFLKGGADPLITFRSTACPCNGTVTLLHELFNHTPGSDIFDFVLSGIIEAQRYEYWVVYMYHILRKCPGEQNMYSQKSKAEIIRKLVTKFSSKQMYAEGKQLCSLLCNLLFQMEVERTELLQCVEMLFKLGLNVEFDPSGPFRNTFRPISDAFTPQLSGPPIDAILSSRLDSALVVEVLQVVLHIDDLGRLYLRWAETGRLPLDDSTFRASLESFQNAWDLETEAIISRGLGLDHQRERCKLIPVTRFSLALNEVIEQEVSKSTFERSETVVMCTLGMLHYLEEEFAVKLMAAWMDRIFLVPWRAFPKSDSISAQDKCPKTSTANQVLPPILTKQLSDVIPNDRFLHGHIIAAEQYTSDHVSSGGNAIWGSLS